MLVWRDVKLSRSQLGCILSLLLMCALYYIVIYILHP